MRRRTITEPFRGPDGKVAQGSIAESSFLRLGGIEQWVLVRGENIANPVMIFLHGGPGLSETTMWRYCNASLEKHFTCVYWDQRGAGKSADASIPLASMTVEQFLSDLDELVDWVCRRLGTTQVTIFGHSWGSALGALYAARHPEKVKVYVGGAQIGDWHQGEVLSYANAVAVAERRGKRGILARLRALGPPPHSADAMYQERTLALRLAGGLPKALWTTVKMIAASRESSLFEVSGAMRAFRWTLRAMWPEVSKLNLIERVPTLEVPTFFFLGRKDPWVPPEASLAYLDVLKAPAKQLVWFEQSGHEMFVDEPARFDEAMIELVLPASLAPRAPADHEPRATFSPGADHRRGSGHH